MSAHAGPCRCLTIPEIAARKASAGKGAPLTMITAYDVVSARLADRAGADLLLVGDSVGMVVLGRENTLSVTVDDMVHHARAVTAAHPQAVVVGDMPFLSCQTSPVEAIRNAGRLLSEGGCQAVKLEGGRRCLEAVERLLAADIPVMGHLGLTPQAVHRMGGFRVQARQAEAALALLEDDGGGRVCPRPGGDTGGNRPACDGGDRNSNHRHRGGPLLRRAGARLARPPRVE